MYIIFNDDIEDIMYIAHNKTTLQEILLSILEEESYINFLYDIIPDQNCANQDINDIAKDAWLYTKDYINSYFYIFKLPDPIN